MARCWMRHRFGRSYLREPYCDWLQILADPVKLLVSAPNPGPAIRKSSGEVRGRIQKCGTTEGDVILAEYMYEGMFLLDSNRFAADPDGVEGAVKGILDRVGASVVASRPWQEGKLCYPIEGHRKGLYYLACFKMDGSHMGELNRLCKLNDTVLRQLVIRHPKVIFDAMVDALTQHDGALHSPEQRPDPRDPRANYGERERVPEGIEEER
jgi:small subunit ribosomal protein S6